MNWTGQLYGFYTEKQISQVFERLQENAVLINYQSNYHQYTGEQTLLFYKDEEMLKLHSELGYNTRLNGEGCFSVEAKMVNLDGVATLFEFEGESDFEPYDINLVFQHLSYFVLVVPGLVEECVFSWKVAEMMRKALRR